MADLSQTSPPFPATPRVLSAPRVVNEIRATLGEGLCWSVREQAIWWVDILEHRLLRDPMSGHAPAIWSFDEPISAIAERVTHPGLAVTLRRGLALFDPRDDSLVRLDEPERERHGNRFNDGKCDAQGRFWGGTMDFDAQAPTGALYCFDAAGQGQRMLDLGWPVTNGPTWSRDRRRIFVNDTVGRRVVAHAFDAPAGRIGPGPGHDWLTLDEADGHPDGMTTDAAGRLWIAHWGGACVTCHDPDTAAELLRIRLPTDHVTNVAFGGPSLTTLFISSARVGLSRSQLAAQPLAGALFAVETDAVGCAADLFAG